ncbi:uncharacterized protein N7443_009263 [Penicillium atrosanguineum]|uniref:Ell binding protein Ebp1 C-terminal domain-containing protein n=1 Tax=Penicillium atrosanguineum TaxID=1132637 RepID=A0A9W9PQ90_9EURO|nr:uncharacterized protein N7443_009263 [Penicillium atrosanguineum]KAJ5126219.1 hypothetical protein N7526_008396 [Penicillium atrosanguineum]KAJ5293310.1 hypothetical protein N7443_009263 [Penicillium atrosanguineum]KAJ5302657.1 hypothetical protein N7476_009456 [Penicillium atrosanguineum]
MSVNDQPPSADTTISHANQPFASDLGTLDQRLDCLSNEVLPPQPYILTLPTNAPFRLGSRSANNWAVGHDRPFSLEEQELQYMTFLRHHDTDSLLVAVGDWSDESGRMMADRSSAPSTTETPKETVAKKKISLKDYKHQKTTGPVASAATHNQRMRADSNSRHEETQPAPKSDLSKARDKIDPPPTSNSQLHLSPSKGPKKRPSTSDIEQIGFQTVLNPDMHSPKKPRLSPEKDTRAEAISNKSQSPRLPALLSPTLPPTKLMTSTTPLAAKLPRLLSPTLPPDLEKELAKFKERSPARQSPKRGILPGKGKRDDAAHSRTPNSTNSGSNSSFQSHRAGASSKESHSSKPHCIVKLRYGKANRRRVEGLLKFSGKRKSSRSDSPLGQDTDHEDANHIEKRRELGSSRVFTTSDRPKTKVKHEPETSLGPTGGSFKERKTSVEKPLTPASNPFPAKNEKVKHTVSTPVKDSKALVPRRADPGEAGGKTPVNPANKRHSVDPGSKESPSQPDSRPRNNERRAWRDEFQKFSNTGRELKHASERSRTKSGASAADEKLALVTAIEAIMCFILAFVADDQSKALVRQGGDSSAWVSILAYWRVVRNYSASYPVLHGLCLLLGAVSYDSIHALDLERLANSPLPGEHTPVPTPGSDGNTVLSDENKKSRKDFLELRNRLLECHRESQKFWLEGTRALSEDVLHQEFPVTWSHRSHNHAERGKIPLKAGDYADDYFLPFGGTTSPIEVVRFGYSMLKEWCTQQDVEWKRRLSL